MTLARSDRELVGKYHDSLRQQNKSLHTLKNYQSDIEHFCFWLRTHTTKKLASTTPEDIHQYSQYLSGQQTVPQKRSFWQRLLSNLLQLLCLQNESFNSCLKKDPPMAVASKRRHLSSLKNFFEFHCQSHGAEKKGFYRNPVRSKLHAIGLKEKDVQHTKTLTQEDFETLLECATKLEHRLALWILYDGALRLEELSKLKFEAFHSPSQTLRFIRKGGNWHTLKLDHFEKIYDMLQAHQLRGRKEDIDWVFSSHSGTALTPRSHYNRLKNLFKKASLHSQMTPHSFRKGRATQLYAQTKDLLYVRDYLNHRDAKVTQTYIDTQYLYS